MKIVAAVAVVALSGAVSGQARAEWQGIDWGMSQSQVEATNTFSFRPASDQPTNMPEKGLLSFDYLFNSYKFVGYVYFVNNKVTMIQLKSDQSGACGSVSNLLSTNYGPPDMVRSGTPPYVVTLPVFLDKARKNSFRVLEIESISSCQIRITPLPAGNSTF